MQIYLDFNATTPVDSLVIEAMLPFLRTHFGNPSSTHWAGAKPRQALLEARERVAASIGCHTDEIIFTSGGSEADNQAIWGSLNAVGDGHGHVITSRVEHPAILETCRWAESRGHTVTYLPVDHKGRVDPADVAAAITDRTRLITIMHANNEVGTLQPLSEIASLARQHGILFHTDAAQSVGKVPVDVNELGVDLLTIVGHKIYAPKGVGALYVRKGTPLSPLIRGGGQEKGLRAGTENVALAVALGKACELASGQLSDFGERVRGLRDHFEASLASTAGPIQINGDLIHRLPNTANISFASIESLNLLASMPEIAASTGSACHADQTEPSPVLQAMGFSTSRAVSAVRFSLGRTTTADEVERATAIITIAVEQLRKDV